jgi:ATP-dependent RNA helicase DHX33
MPPKSSMITALKQLKTLGAIKSTDHPQLTDIGRQMADFPLDPTFSKVIITASHFKCLDDILDLVSILSTENIFCEEINNRDQAAVQHSKFKSNLGDHFTLLNVFSQFKLHNRENKVE